MRLHPEVFEPLHAITLLRSRTTSCRSTPGAIERCCLPRGATRATLHGHLAELSTPAMLLLFEEVLGPAHRRSPATPIRSIATSCA